MLELINIYYICNQFSIEVAIEFQLALPSWTNPALSNLVFSVHEETMYWMYKNNLCHSEWRSRLVLWSYWFQVLQGNYWVYTSFTTLLLCVGPDQLKADIPWALSGWEFEGPGYWVCWCHAMIWEGMPGPGLAIMSPHGHFYLYWQHSFECL